MGVAIVGQPAEQFGDIVAGVETQQLAAGRAKPPQELRLGQQVQGVGRFVEEDYSTEGQQVKSRLEGPLKPSTPFGQSPYLAEFPRKQRHHQTGLAELDGPQHDGGGLFGGHG